MLYMLTPRQYSFLHTWGNIVAFFSKEDIFYVIMIKEKWLNNFSPKDLEVLVFDKFGWPFTLLSYKIWDGCYNWY
jgi:hypothetical protein